jgi:hypothetical protein
MYSIPMLCDLKQMPEIILKSQLVNDNEYIVAKYDKACIDSSNVNSIGIIRSVIFDNKTNKCLSFSPPKSANYQKFKLTNAFQDIVVQKLIEGTMINVFYNDSWVISTKSCVGGTNKFFTTSSTFYNMFIDTLAKIGWNINDVNNIFDKKCTYSFVMQHPDNRIVSHVNIAKLYIIAIFTIEHTDTGSIVTDVTDSHCDLNNIQRVNVYNNFNDYESYEKMMYDPKTMTEYPGVVFKNKYTGEHCKIRNTNHEDIKAMVGNQPNLLYTFLIQLHNDTICKYLLIFPEHTQQFTTFSNKVTLYKSQLYETYVNCFIKHNVIHKECHFCLKNHLYNLHAEYKRTKKSMTRITVDNYFANLNCSQQMHVLSKNNHINDLSQDMQKLNVTL